MAKTTVRPIRRPELPAPPSTPAIDPVSPPTSTDADPMPVRLAVTLTADKSAIDWSRMRESTRDKLIELARRDPKLQGSSAAAGSGPTLEVFSESWCAMIYDALGSLEASMIQRIYHVTADQAAAMLYSDDDKRLLTKPTQKILNKYASSWLASYTDEAALLIVLATVHIAHVQALRATVADAQRPASAPASKDGAA